MLESSLLERNAKIFMNPFPIISHDDGADSSSPAVSGWMVMVPNKVARKPQMTTSSQVNETR